LSGRPLRVSLLTIRLVRPPRDQAIVEKHSVTAHATLEMAS
jgi:hypothetical protein